MGVDERPGDSEQDPSRVSHRVRGYDVSKAVLSNRDGCYRQAHFTGPVVDPCEAVDVRSERFRTNAQRWAGANLLLMDGDEHREVRRLITRAWPVRAQARTMGGLFSELARRRLLDARRLAEEGGVRLWADLALPYALDVTAAALGVPGDRWGEYAQERRAERAVVRREDGRVTLFFDVEEAEDVFLDAVRRRRPGGVIDRLVNATTGSGRRLTERDVARLFVTLDLAAVDTLGIVVGETLLAQVPPVDAGGAVGWLGDGEEELRRRYEETVMRSPPIKRIERRAYATTTLADGRLIRRGELVSIDVAAANADSAAGGAHLSFGWGDHACFGMALARAQTIAFVQQARQLLLCPSGSPRRDFHGDVRLRFVPRSPAG